MVHLYTALVNYRFLFLYRLIKGVDVFEENDWDWYANTELI